MTRRHPTHCAVRRGISLVEASLSMVILAVMATAAAHTVGAARRSDQAAADTAQARLLAQSLLAEILTRPYTDPSGLGVLNGIDLGESASDRATFDDIDDFNGYSESPVQDAAGVRIPGLSSWSRTVTVQWVLTSNLSKVSLVETGIKRVVVTVSRAGKPILSVTAIRARARDQAN